METPTKSDEPHTVPLTDLAMDVLAACPKFDAGDYVFSYTSGRKAVQAFSAIKATVDAKSKAKNWRFHDVRRTVATVFGEHLALPPYIAEAVQNRRSGAISGVVAVYNRARYEQDKRKALEAWAGYVRGAAAGNVRAIGEARA
jgi:integrase